MGCYSITIMFFFISTDLFINSLFTPGAKINPDHKPKYVYIVAYASSVIETWKKVGTLWICSPGTQALLI